MEMLLSRHPVHTTINRNRLAAHRHAVWTLALVGTKTEAPAAPAVASHNDTFKMISSRDSGVAISPSRGHFWIGGWSCDLAPAAVQLDLPGGTAFKSQARLWQNAAGRVFLEAAAVHHGRTFTYLEGEEVRPFSTYYITPGCRVAFTSMSSTGSASSSPGAAQAEGIAAVITSKTSAVALEHHGGTGAPSEPHVHSQHQLVSFTVDYQEPAVSDSIHAMMVNFGRVSTWQQSVLDREALGRMEAAQVTTAAKDISAVRGAWYIYRKGHPFCSV